MQKFVQSPLSSGAMAMYPAALVHAFSTRVVQFVDDSEQRWVVRGELFAATLQYHGVNGYDFSIITAFFNSVFGGYVDPALAYAFSITIDGVTYNNCVLEGDDLENVTKVGDTYSFEMRLKQIAPNSAIG
jgi:hypothetical protein